MTARLLMTTDTVGGVWTYAIDLAAGLADFGVEVLLAATGPSISERQRAQADALPNLRLEFRPGKLEWMDDPWAHVTAASRWLLGLDRDYRPAWVHHNLFVHAALPFSAPVVAVGHWCVCSWFRAVRGRDAPKRFDEYRRRVREGLRAADVVVAPSRVMLDALYEHYHPSARGFVIPNGRRLDAFRPRNKGPFVLGAGRLWDDAKNIGALTRAASTSPWPIYVAGPTISPDHREVSLSGVTTLGDLDTRTLAQWMGRATIFAHPACYEPFGLAVLEAAAAGCALVLGDIPSLRETWDESAIFVPPDDANALSAAIVRLSEDQNLRERLAADARAKAVRMNAIIMAQRYRALYDGLHSPTRELPRVPPGA